MLRARNSYHLRFVLHEVTTFIDAADVKNLIRLRFHNLIQGRRVTVQISVGREEYGYATHEKEHKNSMGVSDENNQI